MTSKSIQLCENSIVVVLSSLIARCRKIVWYCGRIIKMSVRDSSAMVIPRRTYLPARVTQPTARSRDVFHQITLVGKHRASELWIELHVLVGMCG